MGVYTITEEAGNSSFVTRLKRDHPKGTTIILVHYNNLFYPVVTTRGTVEYVDDIGCVHTDFGGNIIPLNYRLGDRWKIINGITGLTGILPITMFSLEDFYHIQQSIIKATNMIM